VEGECDEQCRDKCILIRVEVYDAGSTNSDTFGAESLVPCERSNRCISLANVELERFKRGNLLSFAVICRQQFFERGD
jgi:hypothetical protein